MKKMFFSLVALFCLVSGGTAGADDLGLFGLEAVEPIVDAEGSAVRGQGAFSTSMSSYQIFAFDPVSGTSINLQSSNIALGEDYVVMHSTEGLGSLALSDSAVGMSDLELNLNEFSLDIAAFSLESMGSALTAGDLFVVPHVD